MVSAHLTLTTFRQERWRSLSTGVLDTAANTFLLLIAVRHFEAGALAKAAIAAGSSTGLLLSPFFVHQALRRQWAPSVAVPRSLAVGSLSALAATVVPQGWSWLYVAACLLCTASVTAAIPLLTQIYQDNYPPERRGKFYSRTVMIRIAAAIVFGALAGVFLEPTPSTFEKILGPVADPVLRLLDRMPNRFRFLLLMYAVALAVAAGAVRRIPSKARPPVHRPHPFHALRYVRSDATFRNTLMAWMLMGFANLAMLPLRVEYLGNPAYGLSKTAGQIAFLTLVVPNLARLLISPLWGWLFDRMNFFAMRIVLNLGFALGIAAFFTSNTPLGLLTGAIVFGISNAGGDVAWGLWVTKVTTPDRVADYMSVHTFFTGVRGVLAPIAGFTAIQSFAPSQLGLASGALIVLSCLILIPEWRSDPVQTDRPDG